MFIIESLATCIDSYLSLVNAGQNYSKFAINQYELQIFRYALLVPLLQTQTQKNGNSVIMSARKYWYMLRHLLKVTMFIRHGGRLLKYIEGVIDVLFLPR